MKNLTVTFIVILSLIGLVSAQTQRQDIDIKTTDGFLLRGTFFNTKKDAPSILLLHQCNSTRKGYDNLASMLAAAGFNVLTFDSRGYGESVNRQNPNQQIQGAYGKLLEDGKAAYKFLLSQPNVVNRSIGVVGASCNVNTAVLLSQSQPEVQALVILSGPISKEGKDFIQKSSQVAIFGAAGDKGQVIQEMKETVESSQNKGSKFLWFENAGHGMEMFTKGIKLEDEIVNWFKLQLKTTR